MGAHINKDGLFQSDKYPTCPPGKVPLSVKDKTAQDLLWEYAQRRRVVDSEFSDDLEAVLRTAGYTPPEAPKLPPWPEGDPDVWYMRITRKQHRELAHVLEREEIKDMCPNCGGALQVRPCKGCHFAGPHEHRKCSGCGARFAGAPLPPPEPNVSPKASEPNE